MIKKTDAINILTNLLLNLKQIDIYIIKKIFYASTIFCLYLVFAKPNIVLTIIYSFIGILFFISHLLLAKNYNSVFVVHQLNVNENLLDSSNVPKENTKSFLFKIFFLQARIFLISNWLLSNALLTRKHEVFLNPLCDVLVNAWVSWVMLISLLLGFGYYKYKLNFSNMRLANCLLPDPKTRYTTTLYNYLLGIETYIRLVSFIVLTIVMLVVLFENLSIKLGLNSFLSQSSISSFTVFVIFMYFRVQLENLIDYLSKKISMSFISVFAIALLVITTMIFIVNQLMLSHIEIFDVIQFKSYIIPKIIDSFIFDKDTLKILFIGLNIILSFGAAVDIFLKHIANQKIYIIYYTSIVFPLLYSFLRYKLNFILLMHSFFTTEKINYLMMVLILSIFRFNYKDIYHILCMFGIKVMEKDPQKVSKVKIDFSFVIKSTLMVSMFFLSGYYLFSWVLIEYVVAIGSVLILPIIVALLVHVLIKSKKYLTKTRQLPIFD